MSNLEAHRSRVSTFYASTKSDFGVHTVTFQPFIGKKNEDRVACEKWDLLGQTWVFLAVCDGHAGRETSEYTAKVLPGHVRAALQSVLQKELNGRFGRENIELAEPLIAETLGRAIETFDDQLGERVKEICPNPGELSEAEARELITAHFEPLMLAFNGTTLAAALVNVTHRYVWGMSVGDSSVVLSIADAHGVRHAQRLSEAHSLENPKERARAQMSHPEDEKDTVVQGGRILGWLMVPRAIGDFSLKLPSTYLSHLFRHLPYTGSLSVAKIPERIKTPPYVIATPSVQFTDLQPVWDSHPILTLFSDGVDCLVDGSTVFHPGASCKADPGDVVSKLLQDEVDPAVEEILGHGVDLQWSGTEANKAVDVLGNLIGGTNAERLAMIMDQGRLADKTADPALYVDDVSIIVYPLSQI